MLTTKNYTVSGSQQKINLNYAAVGQITDQKSHRFLKFGLRLHLSVENLCDNSSNSSNNSNSNSPIQDSHHYHHNHHSPPAITGRGGSGESFSPIMEGPSNQHGNNGGSTTIMTMEGDSSNSAVMETFGKYIVKIAEYFRDFEILHREEDQATEEETSSGSGVNSLRELSWETAGMEQQLRERVTQFGNQLSSLRSRIPAKVNELIDSGKDYAKSNPLTFLTIVALVVSCSLPVLVFLAFAAITVAVTFIGFLFVEGTILTVASVVLTSTLLLVGFFTLTITSLLILTYLGVNASYKFITGSPLTETNPIKAIIQFLSATATHNNGDLLNHHNSAGVDELSSNSEDEAAQVES